MKRAFLHTYYKSHNSHEEVRAFGEGLAKHGWTVRAGDTPDYDGEDLCVQWGMRVDPRCPPERTCILEMPYIEPRKDYVSIGFGHGVNGRLSHYGPFEDGSRLDTHFPDALKPWRPLHGFGAFVSPRVIIMGQCPGDMALKGHEPFFHWVLDTYRELEKSGYVATFRPHPNMSAAGLIRLRETKRAEWKTCVHADEKHLWEPWFTALDEGIGVMPDGVPLADALDRARHVVTFNSNSGVDAVLSGVPTVAMDRGSMAWDVTGHKPDEIVTPDRVPWARALAWKQYTRDELRSGYAWDAVCPPHITR